MDPSRQTINVANNNIQPLTKPKQVRLVNFDLESPRMKSAMEELGMTREDLNTRKTKTDFMREYRLEMQESKTRRDHSDNPQIDDQIVSLRFKHYQ